MSYNGSGTFVVNSSGQPVVTGTVISSTAFNALTADLATGLSTAITKDGQTTTTARVPFAQGISSTLVTDATSATTGSIITAGGISCQKALWVGTTSTLAGTLTGAAANFSGNITASAAGAIQIIAQSTVNSTYPTMYLKANNRSWWTSALDTGTDASLAFGIGATPGTNELMRLTPGGLLGIGTTPACTLNIYGANTASRGQLSIESSDTNSRITWYTSGTFRAAINVSSTAISFDPQNNQDYVFPGTGCLLAGVTSTSNAHMFYTAKANAWQTMFQNANASTPYGILIEYTAGAPNSGVTYPFITCRDNVTSRFLVGSSGNVQNANNSYGAISDIKLKQDIVPAASQWNDIKAIGQIVRKYHLKSDPEGPLQIGLVAQDLQLISPGLVFSTPDRTPDEGDLGTETLGVNYSVLYMKAVKALGEALERIETLEARLAALENK